MYMQLALTTTDGSFHLDIFSRWKYFHLPLLDFPKRPEGSWRSCRWGDESQGELITKIWGAEIGEVGGYFHKDDGVTEMFFCWDTTGAMSFSHLTICLAYFPVIFLEGVLEEVGTLRAQGVPTGAQCRWKFRNLRSVSARDVSVESSELWCFSPNS